MPANLTEPRLFEPGTTGWTAHDLDDPEIEGQWSDGRYRVTTHIGEEAGSFASEVEIVVDEDRVARADAAFLTPAEEKRQHEAALAAGRKDPQRTRILIPPTLIIECVSPGHEQHDHRTKRRWYAEFGVPNFWLLNPFKRTLKCLVLRDGGYHDDAVGQDDDKVRPSLFPGLILRLGQIWKA